MEKELENYLHKKDYALYQLFQQGKQGESDFQEFMSLVRTELEGKKIRTMTGKEVEKVMDDIIAEYEK